MQRFSDLLLLLKNKVRISSKVFEKIKEKSKGNRKSHKLLLLPAGVCRKMYRPLFRMNNNNIQPHREIHYFETISMWKKNNTSEKKNENKRQILNSKYPTVKSSLISLSESERYKQCVCSSQRELLFFFPTISFDLHAGWSTKICSKRLPIFSSSIEDSHSEGRFFVSIEDHLRKISRKITLNTCVWK